MPSPFIWLWRRVNWDECLYQTYLMIAWFFPYSDVYFSFIWSIWESFEPSKSFQIFAFDKICFSNSTQRLFGIILQYHLVMIRNILHQLKNWRLKRLDQPFKDTVGQCCRKIIQKTNVRGYAELVCLELWVSWIVLVRRKLILLDKRTPVFNLVGLREQLTADISAEQSN